MLGVADEIVELQAAVLRTLASPRRLEILHRIGRAPVLVHELAEEFGVSQPAISAHLAPLRAAGLVEAVRDGRDVRYRLADPDIVIACDLLRGVLTRRLARLGALVAAANRAALVN